MNLKNIGNDLIRETFWHECNAQFSELIGRTAKEIYVNGDEQILFRMENDDVYMMYHAQDCCEGVYIDKNDTDFNNIKNIKILNFKERTKQQDSDSGSITWTFYKLTTPLGVHEIVWKGESNGFYSERVDFIKVPEDKIK